MIYNKRGELFYFKEIIYPAVFLQEDDGITITFPHLPGCISCADSFEEAYDMAKEAMELFLEDYISNLFESTTKPSKLKDIKMNVLLLLN